MKNLTLVVGVVLLLSGCGPVIDEGGGGIAPGPVCYLDEDCVPNECCGQGTGAVHVRDAPNCRGIQCNGSCAANSVDCGCGLPICRDQRCTVARTVSASCPG